MNYLFYIVVFLSLVGIFLVPIWFKCRLKLDFFTKQIQKIIAAQKTPFFSSWVLREVVRIALKSHNNDILDLLLQGNISKTVKKIERNHAVIALLLKGFIHPAAAAQKLLPLFKKNPDNSSYAAWLALLYGSADNEGKAQSCWDNVRFKSLSVYLKAQHQAHLARVALKNGDLEFSSKLFYQAAGLFNKSQAFYEEAQIYLYLGTVYRVSFLDDVAETLFLSALKCFKLLKYEEGIAKTYANLGILMTGQERFDEADDYLHKALTVAKDIEQPLTGAEIQNQLALLALLKKDFDLAKKTIILARKSHSEQRNTQGIAFSFDLEANVNWQLEKYKESAKQAKKAATLYAQAENISGLLDSQYLLAQSLFKLGDDKEAERILREIIAQGKKDCGCFYLANAYNLLGIVFMKRKDFQRAKGLFQQSLDLEQRGVRLNALAADYANIGLVEKCRGFKETAQKNLQTALDFAKQAEDSSLLAQIQKQLDTFSN